MRTLVDSREPKVEGQATAACSLSVRSRPSTLDPRPARRGFTLIELLVVIAVVAVLAALLLPALSRSQSSAHRIKCVSNLRQLGLATQMYWDENGGVTFAYRGIYTNNGDVYWFGWLERGAEQTREFDPTQGPLYLYLSGRGVEICPSLNYHSVLFKYKAAGAAYGYGYNLFLSPFGKPPLNAQQLPRPGESALFADAAQVNTFQAPASPGHPMLEEFYYVNTVEPTAHFRHRQRADTAFCDGHVDREKPEPGSIDPRLPGEFVGRLRVEILAVP